MRITLRRERRKLGEKLFAAMRIDTLDCAQFSKSARHFNIQQMGDKEGIAARGQIASERIGQ